MLLVPASSERIGCNFGSQLRVANRAEPAAREARKGGRRPRADAGPGLFAAVGGSDGVGGTRPSNRCQIVATDTVLIPSSNSANRFRPRSLAAYMALSALRRSWSLETPGRWNVIPMLTVVLTT